MRVTTGTLLMVVGGLHQVVGLVLYRGPLWEMASAGVLASVPEDMGARAAAFWFLVAGWGMMLLGALARWVERETGRPPPASFGWGLLGLGVFLVVPMPVTGGWVLLPLGLLALRRAHRFVKALPGVPPEFLEGAHHVDVKTVESELSLREFVARLMSYQPAWVTALFTVRGVFVRLLGLRQVGVPQPRRLRAEDVPMSRGATAAFFTVRHAEEERAWVVGAEDSHLDAVLAVCVEPGPTLPRRFHVVTVVRYRNWAGPVYFNVIRPFHHLVVGAMARAAAGTLGSVATSGAPTVHR
ncbi:DUF6463 family protein [Myxococcus sp. CA039A]|uniref:DUF6463 family protein n=1 Tax=Myxococcus sp. CA039A TaxID=2741737 RepID=UPI00157A7AB9|nr:DUF6463 family protein [Myxococcus sp. CA039A]NTX53740.1 DUF2867 domain-containing protein [Myxococcus sp. CA039A]